MITLYALSAFKPELKGLIRDIRIAWALEELGLPYTRKVMDPLKKEHKSPEFLKLNPFGKVPTIQDGDFTLYESSAICSYLGDKVGKLIPKAGTKERVSYDQWTAFTISTLEPQVARILGFDFFNEKDATTEKLRATSVEAVQSLFQVLDERLTKQPYILGETFSLADVQLTSVCRFVEHTEIAARYPSLTAYLKKNYQRTAFLKAYEQSGT